MSTPDLATLIRHNGADQRSRLSRLLRLLRLLLPVAVVLLAVAAWFRWSARARAASQPPPFVTETLARGDIRLTVTATGNLEPTTEVTVGSELSGTTLEVYVDTNDHVTRGQPLAKLDTTRLAQETESSRARLASARAGVAQAEATLGEAQATLARQQELHRLSGGKVPSRLEMDTATAAADRARADLLAAQASVSQARAELGINETDLGKAIIKSPINGIVLTRALEPGQTVAASFTAPELFVIAEKLEHMKLKVAVAEADIGRVANGQASSFTVDAWPNRSWSANVIKVSYGSAVIDNVVTYETELEVANDDLSLRPGMTATADIHVAEAKNVYLVPSAAFRFNPQATLAAGGAFAATAQKKSFVQSLMPGPPRRPPSRPADTGDASASSSATATSAGRVNGTARIWVLREGRPVPVQVKVGLTDGRRTEVSGDDLADGLPVILRASAPAS
ncbi:MAG: efflux RND transporter periplasmic adaptor subunit [Opitutaceae bacterium]|jgi:HlyD family secretion protein|nr:efflux RND transporter periplasmic adaptor subunit [Opitutaceae bacterium]